MNWWLAVSIAMILAAAAGGVYVGNRAATECAAIGAVAVRSVEGYTCVERARGV